MVRQRRIAHPRLARRDDARQARASPRSSTPRSIDALERCIADTGDHPTLRGVYEELGRLVGGRRTPTSALADGAVQPRFVLRRFVDGDLSGLFEDESTVAFDAGCPDRRRRHVASCSPAASSSRSSRRCARPRGSRRSSRDRAPRRTRYVIREEGWRDMTSLASLQMFQQWLKLSRHYGISNIVILHKMGDLDAVGDADSQERNLAYSIVGDIENKFIFRVNHQETASLRERLNIPAAARRDGAATAQGRVPRLCRPVLLPRRLLRDLDPVGVRPVQDRRRRLSPPIATTPSSQRHRPGRPRAALAGVADADTGLDGWLAADPRRSLS